MSTMTNPHNVDICVTCVSEKPPQLPLREELPSLGIEVIYNAHGVGAKATRHEQKKKLKKFQKEKLNSNSGFFSKLKKKLSEEDEKRQEAELRIPHALSYSSYQRRLDHQLEDPKKDKEGSEESEESSCKTNSTVESSNGENNLHRHLRPEDPQSPTIPRTGNSKPPIKSLEIPTHSPEELALQEAFDVFADASLQLEERSTPEAREALFEVSSQSNNASSTMQLESRQPSQSTLSSRTSSSQHVKVEGSSQQVKVEAVKNSIKKSVVRLSSTPDKRLPQDYEAPSVQSLEDMAEAYLSKYISPRITPTESHRTEESRPSDEGQDYGREVSNDIRMSQANQNYKMSDFYDLTSISDEDKQQIGDNTCLEEEDDDTFNYSKDLSTLSSKKDHPEVDDAEVEVYPSAGMKNKLEGLKCHIPEEDDGYGRIVFDLSDVMEEDGPGSPLIYSPQRGYSDVVEIQPRQWDPVEEREDDEVVELIPRFASMSRRDDPFSEFASDAENRLALLRNSRGRSLFDENSTIEYPKQRRFTFDRRHDDLEDSAAHTFPRKSFSGDSDINEEVDRFLQSTPVTASFRASFLPTASPRGLDYADEERTFVLDDDPISEALSPTLKQSFSRESDARSKLSVSFSQDIEAHYYSSGEEVTTYEEIAKMVDEIDHGGFLSASHSDVDDSVDAKFDSFFSRTRNDNRSREYENPKAPHIKLQEALLGDGPLPFNAAKLLSQNPNFLVEKLPGTDTYPLHAACALEFPNRFEGDRPCLVKDLVNDISERKQLILAFLQGDASCCKYLDSENDLPVHIISRQLMEWEAKWYQKVYEKARDDGSEHSGSGAGITTLYQSMSHIVDVLLKPLAVDEQLCKQPGSMGYLLPLHIAAIFTVSYNTLKTIIEKYPAAASQKCNLDNIRTFIPNFSIPLELHSRLSTDFPKWEIEPNHSGSEEEIQWTQATLDRSYKTTGGMRRSDLMFAFHPDVSPYRHETPRIRRLEARITSEAESLVLNEGTELSMAARLIWEWMCTYEGEHKDDNYTGSVRKIIESLSLQPLKLLAATPTQHGRPIIDCARSECTQAIQERLEEISTTMIPLPIELLSSGFTSRQRSFFLREWEEKTANQFCLHGRGFVGVVCRTLFNISEASFPSSFVILPYKLVKDSDGRLGLESATAAAVAMKFADCLLHLTDPSKILHFLEKKAIRFNGMSLGIEASPDWDKVEAKTKQQVSKLLSLYASGQGFLYFIDEYTGVPIVPDKDDLYPLRILDAIDTVRRVLPLMMTGMILMRGEKALSVLANVLLNDNIKMVQEHWVKAAKDLVGYLYSPQTEWTTNFLNDLRPLRTKLVDFVERGVSNDTPSIPPEGLLSEWVVESSLLKMIVEMFDSQHTLSGLRPRRAGRQVLWTREAAFLDPNSREHLMQMDFKSLAELKEQSDQFDEDGLQQRTKTNTHTNDDEEVGDLDDASTSSSSGYELLFRELSFRVEEKNLDEPDNDTSLKDSKLKRRFIAEPPTIVRRRIRYASASEPISLLKFDDDDMDLDDVLQLRILLDEQEAKLDFLRDKVTDLQAAEMDLLEQEDRLGEMLNEVNNQKDLLMSGVPRKGLSSARKLLIRICDLEDRVRLREVEMGQLKNDISCFELEAAKNEHDDFLYDM